MILKTKIIMNPVKNQNISNGVKWRAGVSPVRNWISNGVAWLREYSLNIAIAVVILSLIVLMATVNYLYLFSPETIAIKQAQKSYAEQVHPVKNKDISNGVNKDQPPDIFKRARQRLFK